ncbi:phasin family protein [Croceicoccus hydrothermalis]|uniref:phasin family protein n=1 Tax=Croceicoccus hydrothermalis TaxID=2867964 RepID=UPI001EFBC108|nr:phasin family protein [Croceicoccus hydrothermalis]
MADSKSNDAPIPKPDAAKASIPVEQDTPVTPPAAEAKPAPEKVAEDGAPLDAELSKAALRTAPASAAPVKTALVRDRATPQRSKTKKSVTQTTSASFAKKAKATVRSELPVARKAAPRKAAAMKKAVPPRPTLATGKTDRNTEKKFMALNTEEMTKTVESNMGEMSARTKNAFEKGSAMFQQAGDFAKGNVEAIVESNKILAAGLQELSRDALAESKAEFEAMTAEMKEMAAVKSPTDFFQMQSTFMRKQFDKAVALSSKNTEAMLKLANEASQPLSNRMSVAMEKAKTI